MTTRSPYAEKLVVVVDDNYRVVELTRDLLRSLGVGQTLGYTDPEQAFNAFTSRHVDAAIIDLVMPGLDGLALARRIRGSDRVVNAVMPIVLATAHAEQDIVEKAIRAGIDEVLVKPYSPRVLWQRMSAVFDWPRTYIRTPAGYFGPDRRRRRGAAATGPDPAAGLFADPEVVTLQHLLDRREKARLRYGRVPPSPLEPPPPVLTGPVTKIPVVGDPDGAGGATVRVPTPLRREIASMLAARESEEAAPAKPASRLARQEDPPADDVHIID